jgi:predicted Fe-Mo cluster-binding NifX family protein
MRVAIPQWQGRISPVLDSSSDLLLIDVDAGHEVRREERQLPTKNPLARALEIADFGVETVICGAISAPMEARLVSNGVRVIGFICGTVDEVLQAFLHGDLARPAFAMPGCQGRRGKGGKGMRRGFGVRSGGNGRGRGRGGHGGMGRPFAAGPGGQCVCPNCGEKSPHTQGQPCNQMLCPKCGTPMTRA